MKKTNNEKSRLTACLLAFFLGGFGVHAFYLGQKTKGVLMLIFFWTLIPSFIAFIDFIVMATMKDETFNSKFNK